MIKINIAIDGPVASGKGTIAKLLAKKLNYNYLDTGAMYRAVAFWMNENNITIDTFKENLLDKISINFNKNNEVILNGKNISNLIRTPFISKLASDFSSLIPIRKFLVKEQQKIVRVGGYVAEGRDIGTVVIADAKIKIYLTANINVRAKRRLEDYKNKGINISLDEIKNQILIRDKQDKEKKVGALKIADDAIEIDNSNMTIDSQIKKIINLVKNNL